MFEQEIQKIEGNCMSNIKSNNIKEFELNFNLYTAMSPNTKNTAYIKTYMLLHLISERRLVEYYKLLQTVTLDELEDEYIKVVLFLEKAVNTGNLNRLLNFKNVCQHKEFVVFVEKIYSNMKNSLNAADNKYKQVEELKDDKYSEKIIRDSIFISCNTNVL